MAIYISGVKGLPEQVQANKEDIEQIKEDIGTIDFDAIRELTAQVGENTQDINNLENGQGVQDQAINGLGDRVTTAEGKITQLETDTQKITYNTTDDETRIQGTTRIAVIKNNRIGDDDSIITFGTANGIELRQGNHILNYDDQGKLYLDGVEVQPVQPPLPKYVHNILLYYYLGTGNSVSISLQIINDSNNAFNYNSLLSYINSYFRGTNKMKPASGTIWNTAGNKNVIGIGTQTSLTDRFSVYYIPNTTQISGADLTHDYLNSGTVTDIIEEI